MDSERALALLGAKAHQDRLKGIGYIRKALQAQQMLIHSAVDSTQSLPELLKAIAQTLADSNWNVKREAVALASDLLPANAVAANYLLANLLVTLCDSKVTIRKSATAAISNWLAAAKDPDKAFELLDKRGLQNQNPQVRAEVLGFLESDQCLSTTSQPALTRLLAGVTKRVLDSDEDVKFAARQTIQAISQRADPSLLERAVQQLPSGLRQRYLDTHASLKQASPAPLPQRAAAQSTAMARAPPASQQQRQQQQQQPQQQQQQHNTPPAPGPGPGANAIVFGCIPAHLVHAVRGSDNMQGRVKALGEIHRHLEALETGTHVLPHLQPLLKLLTTLMQDVNLKVIVGAMEATGVLVRKLGWPIRNHLDLLVNKLALLLGDSKIVVRQSAARLLNRLMHTLTPAPVLHILLKHLDADGWRVREEVINIVIVAMSTFMPDRFDFERLAALLVPGLRDKRSRIKFVTIEAFAVMASIVGQPRLQQLLSPYSLDGSTRQSLQERLEAANELPSITDDGMVHHTNLQESSDSRVGSTISQPLASSAGLSRMPWLATPNSRGDQTLSSLSSKAASASSIHTAVRNGIRSGVDGDDGDDMNDTASVPSTASSAVSSNSYARMHRHKLAGKPNSSTSSSYASWARRSKKLKHKSGSGYAATSRPDSISADVSVSSISSAAVSTGPSRTRKGKSRKKIPFVESRMARPSSSSSAEPLSGMSSAAPSRHSSVAHAPTSPVRGQGGGTGTGRRKAGSYVAAHSPTGRKSTSPRANRTNPQQQQPRPVDSKFARIRSDSRLVVEDARNGQSSPGTSRSWDPKRHGHSMLDTAADEPDRIELSDPKARHHPTYAPQTIVARRPRRGSYARTPPTTTTTTTATTAPSSSATAAAKATARGGARHGSTAAQEGAEAEAVAIGRHATRSPGSSDEQAATELVDGATVGDGSDGSDGAKAVFKPHPPLSPRQKSDSRFRTSTPIGAVSSREPTGHEGSHLPMFGFKQQQQEHEQEKARQRIAEAKRREQEQQQREQEEREREEAERIEREREFKEKEKERRKKEKERIQRERERRLREKAKEEEREQKEREEREEKLKRLDEQRRQQRQKQQEARKLQQQQEAEEQERRRKQEEAEEEERRKQWEAEEERRRKQQEEEQTAAAERREQERKQKQQQQQQQQQQQHEKERQTHAPRKRPPRPPSHISVEEYGAQPQAVPRVEEVREEAPAHAAAQGHADRSDHSVSVLSIPGSSASPASVGDRSDRRQRQRQQQENEEEKEGGNGAASMAATPRKQQHQRATAGKRSVPSSLARTRGRARTGAKSTRGGGGGGGKASANDPYLVDIDTLEPPSGSADAAWKQAQQSLEKGKTQELWMEKCEGLAMIRRLVLHQPEFAVGVLGDVVRGVLQEVKNLRSSVSRLAILTCGDLCRLLGKPTEKHVDDIMAAVLVKAGGEASIFIKEDAEAALLDVVDALSPYKVAGALLPQTAHKNREVRRMSAKLLVPALQRAGAKMLAHRDAPKLLRRLAQLVTDGDQETRYYGRLLANEIMAFDGYEKAIQRHVEGRPQRELLDVCETVRKKGVGAPPMAATHRGGAAGAGVGGGGGGGSAAHTSRVSTRKTSTSSTGSADASTASVGARTPASTSATPQRRAKAGGGGARARQRSAVQSATPFKTANGDDLLKVLGKDLKSSDWKTREATIAKLRDLVLKSPDKFVGSATNVFFDFVPRLQDSNSKVNVSALRALVEMLPVLPDALEMVMAELLSSLTMGLASKNSNINGLTRDAVKLVVTGVNPSHVAQPLMTTLLNANSVIREALLPYLAQFVPLAAQSNPKLLQKHVVSGCIKLLSDNKLSPRTAPVWVALHNELGDGLFKRKAFTPAVTAQVRKLL